MSIPSWSPPPPLSLWCSHVKPVNGCHRNNCANHNNWNTLLNYYKTPSCLVYLQTQPNAIHMHTSHWRRWPNLSASKAPRLFLSFLCKACHRFSKESNPEPSLLTLWDTGKWQTRASLTFSMLMDQIDEKRTKPNITSQFHSFGSTGVHREVCSTKAKQRGGWFHSFIHSIAVPWPVQVRCISLATTVDYWTGWLPGFSLLPNHDHYYQMTPTTNTSRGWRSFA